MTYNDGTNEEEGFDFAQISTYAAQDANAFCSEEAELSKCEKGICK